MEPQEPPELHLSPDIQGNGVWHPSRNATAGSIAFHVVAVLVLTMVKAGPVTPRAPERQFVRHVTPLYIPPDLTQKAPNKEPVSKELTIAAIAPRPIAKAPVPVKQAALPAPPQPQVAPKPVQIEPPKIEPPKIEASAVAPPAVQLPKSAPLPPPPAAEPPKLALEDVNPRRTPTPGKPTGAFALPSTSIADAVRSVTRSSPMSGITVVDADEAPSAFGLNLPPSAGRPHSSLELKSDPMGVDFRGYMTQVLAAVRRSWFAVYPEAARLGQRGQVALQFAILKQGVVTKVVFTSQTGAKALDQSAVAAISASNPLPPLPPEFKGDRIILQMTFSYNMPR